MVPDFSTLLILGALVGLLFVAVGYGQLVWLQRQAKSRIQEQAGDDAPSSPLLTALFWVCVVLSAICLLRAVTSRVLPEQEAQLSGEELFSVAQRTGLVASYEGRSNVVHKGDIIIRFAGRDGEEGMIALKNRKQILQGDMEIERARPIEFDPEIMRRVDTAKALLQERSSRQKTVLAERDSIEREATQQRLNVDNRRFRAEQDLRTAQRELEPLKANLETAKSELESQQQLLQQGLLSKMEVARARDKVTDLEGQINEREGRAALLERELKEVATLNAAAEKTYSGQGATRTQESSQITSDIADARKAVAAANLLLEQDRPRATAQRDKRLKQIQIQIDECDSLLSGNGKKAVVEAPFDGRIGFREPSPSSPPSDNGPLMVIYKPGKISATVHLDEGSELEESESDLGADVIFSAETTGRERTLNGEVLARTVSRGEAEIMVAVDPPERVVRAIAMGGSVPVRVRLKRGVTGALPFRFGLGLGAFALALAGLRSFRARFQIHRVQPRTQTPPGGTPPAGTPPFSGDLGGGGGSYPPFEPDYHYARAPGVDPYAFSPEHVYGQRPRVKSEPGMIELPPARSIEGTRISGGPFARPPGDDLTADERDPLYLRRLGARLRDDVEGANLSTDLVRRVHQVIGRGGFNSTAMVMSGFGQGVDKRHLARAAFDLHVRTFEAAPPAGGLSNAAVSCAEFLQVMRAVGADRLGSAIDTVRSELIAATLAAAERGGSTSENAGQLVKPLMEV